jgi:aldose sugar dehydrogenase
VLVSACARRFDGACRLARSLTAGALLGLAAAHPASGQATVEIVAARLDTPWALAFAVDGRLFVTERAGWIRLVAGGRLQGPPVAERGESGLMGLALDPRFDDNGQLCVCYTAAGRAGGVVNRVGRLTVREGVAAQEVVVLDGMPAASIHDGCRLKFGPGGKLDVTTSNRDGRGQPAAEDDRIFKVSP